MGASLRQTIVAGVLLVAPFSVASAGPYSDAVLNSGPLAYYRLDETELPTAFNSGSGTGIDGTYLRLGTGTGAGNIGQLGPRNGDLAGVFAIDGFEADNRAVHFDAPVVDANPATNFPVVTVPDSLNNPLDITGALTLEAWIFRDPQAAGGNNEGIVGKYWGSTFGNQRSYVLFYDPRTDNLGFTLSDTGLNVNAYALTNTTGNVPLGQWTHVAATYEPSTRMALYINGEIVAERLGGPGIPASIFNSEADLWIGKQFSTAQNVGFEGKIDEVAIYDRALSAAEIAAHFDAATTDLPTSFAWNVNASGDWNDTANWTFTTVPNNNQRTAVLGGAISEARVVYTNAANMVKGITFVSNASYTIGGTGSLTLSSDTGTSDVTMAGTHTIAAVVNLANDTTVAGTGTLNMTNVVNLGANQLTIDAGTLNLHHAVTSTAGGVVINNAILGTQGILDLQADLVSTGTLDIDIAGTNPHEYDVFHVSGTATLSGTLSAELFNGFALEGNETFTVLTATNLIDNGITLGGPAAQQFALSVVGNSLVLSVAIALNGDFNNDGVVDAADYLVWRNNYGAANEDALNGNGDGMNDVDTGDYLLWKENFGATAGGALANASATVVPEPATIAMAAAFVLALGLVRQRGRQCRWVFTGMLAVTLLLSLTAQPAQAQYSAAVLADGPVAYYRLNEQGDGLTFFAQEASNPSLDAAFENIGLFGETGPNNIGQVGPRPGDIAGGFVIDGFAADNRAVHFGRAASGYSRIELADDANTPNPLDITGSLTLEAWVNRDAQTDGGANEGIISKYFGTGNNRSYNLFYDPTPGVVGFVISDTGLYSAANEILSPTDLAIGEWTHVVGVFNQADQSLSLYFNGQLVASRTSAATSIFDGTAPFHIGHQFNTSPNSTFEGRIDEAAIYNKALTDAQVLTHFEAATGASSGAYTWNVNGSGDWRDLNNWSQASVPNRDNAVVNFGSVITSPQSVVVEDEVRAKTINFSSSHKYVVVGFDEVALVADTGDAAINVTQGSHEFQVPVRLDSDTVVTVTSGSLSFNQQINLNGNTLTIAGAGNVDINNRVFFAGGGQLVNAGALAMASGMELGGDFTNEGELDLMLGDGPALAVAGIARLGGTLNPTLAPGAALKIGDVYAAVVAGDLQDDGIVLAGDLAGMLRVSSSGSQLLLTVVSVPEPASVGLVTLLLALLGLVRRRNLALARAL